MLIRRFFAFVISAFLIFYPAYSYATTSVGGWTAIDTITAGATNTINATKTAGGKVLKSAVTIAPQAANVGKHLIKGGGAAALAFAMVELADGAIDWVLDPANNRVRYTAAGVADGSRICKQWSSSGYNTATAQSICNANASPNVAYTPSGGLMCSGRDFTSWNCGADSYPVDVEKYVSAEALGAKVISNAEAGHPDSQEAVKATALEGFAAGEYDAALDAAATEAGAENPPDTDNPPKDPAAPAEPFDPAGIISAINALKALLAGILSSMTGFFDWVQAPVPPDNEEKKDVPFATTGDVGLDDVDRFEQRVDFRGQCPANDFSVSILGVTYSKPIPYHYFCGFLEQIAPWLLAMCYLGTAYFIVENV